MNITLQDVGNEHTRIVVIDDLMTGVEQVIDMAAALAPFSHVENHYYPGLRRLIRPDETAFQYVDFVCRLIAPVLKQAFALEQFRITEAGFSLVTRRPEQTQLIQRIPHFDSADPKNFAVLHYLGRPDKGGTGFYRHRATGFEVITPDRVAIFREALDQDVKNFGPPPAAYIADSTQGFERIGVCEGVFNRLVIYQGALLHSGLIPDDFDFNPDPRRGRLTGNIFLQTV